MFGWKSAFALLSLLLAVMIVDGITVRKCDVNSEFECEPGVCIRSNQTCDGVYDCELGQDEAISLCNCAANEFKCTNSCIPIEQRCDLSCDCEDDCADSKGCDVFPCLPVYVKCKNHLCIPHDMWCNFINDCGDNSDEETCAHRSCWKGEFSCANGQCVSTWFVCDGVRDCIDGSDEARCTHDDFIHCDGKRVFWQEWCDGDVDCLDTELDETNCTCAQDEYRCPNGKCLRPSVRCNGVCDCKSCQDEVDCSEQEMCNYQTNGFLCPFRNGLPTSCVKEQYVCDGHHDCVGGMDETYCDKCISVNHTRCNEGGDSNDRRCFLNSNYCDGRPHCVGGTDERACPALPSCNPSIHFECASGRCVNLAARCNGRINCLDVSDETDCEAFECPANTFKCRSGQCIPMSLRCDYRPDCFFVDATIDTSDEDSCDYKQLPCEDGEFRCKNDQCIPGENRCFFDSSGQTGCRDGSHLYDCGNWSCGDGEFKCRNSYCVRESDICNGQLDCRYSYSDEANCTRPCPTHDGPCECFDISINCTDQRLKHFGFRGMEKKITYYDMSGNRLAVSNDTFAEMSHITRLDISRNGIADIDKNTFSHLIRLIDLNLEYNNISVIREGTFSNLPLLRNLKLKGNAISRLERYAFIGLASMTTLDLSGQNLTSLNTSAFFGMRQLRFLDLSLNNLIKIPDGSFFGLQQLQKLDITGNQLSVVTRKTFNGLVHLDTLLTDEYRFCCMAKHVPQCRPLPNEFSSCEDLMSNVILRMCIWLLGIVALVGNAFVIAWRINSKRDNRVHSFLITNLAIGDMLMGVYLLIIAAVDAFYRGVYILHDKNWRGSSLCQFAGFLSTFSSELSVLSLTIITLHRLSSIVFPFRIKDMEFTRAVWVMGVSWALVAFLAGLPLCGLAYFGNFYGRSGVCLALHITPDWPSGWEYAVFIFLAINFVSFMTILISYGVMFNVARKTQKAAMRSLSSKVSDSMARRMSVIVFTDFCCWMPIIILGVASLCGASIPPAVYAWVAVFVMPVNSAVNPVLYTLGSAPTIRTLLNRARSTISSQATHTTDYKLAMNSTDKKQMSRTGGKGRPGRGMTNMVATTNSKPISMTVKPKLPPPCPMEKLKMNDIGHQGHHRDEDDVGEKAALTSGYNNNVRTSENI
ncbi:G-protein coupled receptor GRL101-like [Diadema antillarum]|uniref:G-protein coupled receptor GRL101-like n=1 Tax=Diadema antillarum TaxID=105358 RepID=UPI003A8804E6